ncbi:MAG: helix-turn-helix domain-containing protein [Gulosibacter sp.]|uniref:helix-turn-helix domain-containing protein n=1 Tax=Gulosibacter sp. TaxID=2817531 RepID=UPI003F8E3CF5
MKELGLNRKTIAAEMGTSQEYLGRVFRGEIALSAQVLGGLEMVLGPLTFVAREVPTQANAPRYRTTDAIAAAKNREKELMKRREVRTQQRG